jgi:crotonobetainyl-CoA:carnitine CoA-transferase CaiB-like acyl-CoA transferase
MGGFEPSYAPGPALGADGEAILRELGYDEAAAAELRADGAFGRATHDSRSLERIEPV